MTLICQLALDLRADIDRTQDYTIDVGKLALLTENQTKFQEYPTICGLGL